MAIEYSGRCPIRSDTGRKLLNDTPNSPRRKFTSQVKKRSTKLRSRPYSERNWSVCASAASSE